MVAALAFYSYHGHPRWNPVADVNKDDIVTVIDIVLIVQNLEKHHNISYLHYALIAV